LHFHAPRLHPESAWTCDFTGEYVHINLTGNRNPAPDIIQPSFVSNPLKMTQKFIAKKEFTAADQVFFAELSGDRNPIHMDRMAARRTQAGALIVHGIHSLLWSVEAFAAGDPNLPRINTLKGTFAKMVYVGDTLSLFLSQLHDTSFRLEAKVDEVSVLRLSGTLGPASPPPDSILDCSHELIRPSAPMDLRWENIGRQSGCVARASSRKAFEGFPAASRLLGENRIAAIASSSFVVGMVCPGLHSILSSVSIAIHEEKSGPDVVAFRVANTDPRFRLVRLNFSASGISGSIDSFARMPPVSQLSIAEVSRLVAPKEFAGAKALVVGGSRGLGELTAKIIAAGGGQLVSTYATGRTEAERIQSEIAEWGGRCGVRPYDVNLDPDAQLSALADDITSLYYFATPTISRRKLNLFSEERFREFVNFYVVGFHRLCESIVKQQKLKRLCVFYPSTVFIDSRPADMTEYVMAKSAGEVLCAELNAQAAPLHVIVSRLPRLLTDQTATVMPVKTPDAIQVMLPIVREVERYGSEAEK